jgi:hypothetical protein
MARQLDEDPRSGQTSEVAEVDWAEHDQVVSLRALRELLDLRPGEPLPGWVTRHASHLGSFHDPGKMAN